MKSAPVTVARLERGMDRLAGIILSWGEEGKVFLPIYARLEGELLAMREADRMMSDITVRAFRSLNQRSLD